MAASKTPQPVTNSPKITPLMQAIVQAKSENPNLTNRDIGQLTNSDHSHVSRVLNRFGLKEEDTQNYKKGRANVFAGLQGKILQTITLDDIKKSSVLQRVTSAGILYDKERLELDKSTANVSIHADIRALKAGNSAPEDAPGGPNE